MILSIMINCRASLNLWVFALLMVCVFNTAACGLISETLTESEKRQQIEILYAGYKKEFPEIIDLPPRKAMELAHEQKVVFIDVRESSEQQVSMLANAVTDKTYLINPDKYKDYIIIGYCTISYRSGIFIQQLQKKGIRAYNLRGGILAWTHDGGKVYQRGKETNRIHIYGPQWNLAPDRYKTVW